MSGLALYKHYAHTHINRENQFPKKCELMRQKKFGLKQAVEIYKRCVLDIRYFAFDIFFLLSALG